MKRKIQNISFIALLGLCIVLAGLIKDANATGRWSNISVACVPDDDTTPAMYDVITGGVAKFQGNVTGDIYFWCNVTSPDNFPTWNRMYLTYKDSVNDGFVAAALFKKRYDNGEWSEVPNSTIVSNTNFDSTVILQESTGVLPFFDFSTYSYHIKVRLNRTTGNTLSPEFHIVSIN